MTLAARFWAKVDRRGAGECWPWIGAVQSNGYGHLSRGARGTGHVLAHRVAHELEHGTAPAPGVEVCHSCDVRLCVNPAHLFLGTSSDNHQDMVAKDRHTRGERSANALLTAADVYAIRLSTESSNVIAPRYGVSGRHVRAIRAGKAWAHLRNEAPPTRKDPHGIRSR